MCMSPNSIKVPETVLKIFPESQRFISVPCGKCDECRISNSKEGGIRCMCELQSLDDGGYNNSGFITLTYDNEHNPLVLGNRHKRNMQLFIKRLRKHFNQRKIKYFYCSEYGSELRSHRPHSHMIVYNLPLKTLKFKERNFQGDILGEDKELSQIGGMGSVIVGNVSIYSASYTARYCLKKNDTDCYMRCSNGFGKKYFFDHMNDIITNGYVSVPVGEKIVKCKIPRYFLKLYRKYLNDDEKYSDFLVGRNKQIKKYQGQLISKIDISFDIPLKQGKEIGNMHPALLLNASNRRIAKQALVDMYKFSRDNF